MAVPHVAAVQFGAGGGAKAGATLGFMLGGPPGAGIGAIVGGIVGGGLGLFCAVKGTEHVVKALKKETTKNKKG